MWLILLVCVQTSTSGQSINALNVYQRTQDFINPAFCGSTGILDINLDYRREWVEFQGAPTSILLSAAGKVGNRVAMGLNLESRTRHVERIFNISTNYAYLLPLSQGNLHLGLKAGLMSFAGNYSQVLSNEAGDLAFRDDVNRWQPNFGAGAFYRSNSWYAGVSIPMLLQDNTQTAYSQLERAEQQHCTISAGYRFMLNELFMMQPNMLLSFSRLAGPTGIVGLSLYYQESIWTGLSYDSDNAINARFHYQLSERISAGYGYETALGKLRNQSKTAHLINVRYNIKSDGNRYPTPY